MANTILVNINCEDTLICFPRYGLEIMKLINKHISSLCIPERGEDSVVMNRNNLIKTLENMLLIK